MVNALIISEKDNVVIAIENIKKGGSIHYKSSDGKLHSFEVLDDIPIYHKVALKDLNKGDYFIKYGEHIGLASCNIKKGVHVHEHNVESKREKLV